MSRKRTEIRLADAPAGIRERAVPCRNCEGVPEYYCISHGGVWGTSFEYYRCDEEHCLT